MYRYLPVMKKNNDLGEFINDFFGRDIAGGKFENSFKLDVKDNEKEYIVDAYLDGAKKEDIKIDYENDNLIISVTYAKNEEEKKENYIHRERIYESNSRSIYLPEIDDNSIKAKYADGILSISVPKKEKENLKKPILIE